MNSINSKLDQLQLVEATFHGATGAFPEKPPNPTVKFLQDHLQFLVFFPGTVVVIILAVSSKIKVSSR